MFVEWVSDATGVLNKEVYRDELNKITSDTIDEIVVQ